jgi:hypothetical protein
MVPPWLILGFIVDTALCIIKRSIKYLIRVRSGKNKKQKGDEE